eukprot:3896383-Rhodomonas_salina.1
MRSVFSFCASASAASPSQSAAPPRPCNQRRVQDSSETHSSRNRILEHETKHSACLTRSRPQSSHTVRAPIKATLGLVAPVTIARVAGKRTSESAASDLRWDDTRLETLRNVRNITGEDDTMRRATRRYEDGERQSRAAHQHCDLRMGTFLLGA